MIDKVGDNKSFNKNLQKFKEAGHISGDQEMTLSAVLEAGHASIHRAYSPNFHEVSTAVSILGNVIDSIYILPLKNRMHLSSIPGRE